MRTPRSFALCNKMLGTNLWLQVPSVVCRGTASVPEMSAGSINSFAKAELPLVKTWRRGVRRLRKKLLYIMHDPFDNIHHRQKKEEPETDTFSFAAINVLRSYFYLSC